MFMRRKPTAGQQAVENFYSAATAKTWIRASGSSDRPGRPKLIVAIEFSNRRRVDHKRPQHELWLWCILKMKLVHSDRAGRPQFKRKAETRKTGMQNSTYLMGSSYLLQRDSDTDVNLFIGPEVWDIRGEMDNSLTFVHGTGDLSQNARWPRVAINVCDGCEDRASCAPALDCIAARNRRVDHN